MHDAYLISLVANLATAIQSGVAAVALQIKAKLWETAPSHV